MEVVAVAVVLLIVGAVGLGLYLKSKSWQNRALEERTRRQEREAREHKTRDLDREAERTDEGALEQWRKNFGD